MSTPLVPALLAASAVALSVWIVRLVHAWRLALADESIERSLEVGPGAGRAELLAALARAQRAGRGALVTRPWRLVLGAEASGKSEWLAHSGQSFIERDEDGQGRAFAGAGQTRTHRWWLAADGITIERAGRALARGDEPDEQAWSGFLERLAHARGGRGFDAVIVVLSAPALAAATPEWIAATAADVRDRLIACARGTRQVPGVHLLITQLDRLAGFADFFADLPFASRDAVWGSDTAADGRAAGDRFATLWRALDRPVRARRLERAAEAGDRSARARAFCFPEQLARLRDPLGRFVAALFAEGGADAAQLRSLAACAAHAAGEVEDHVRVPIAQNLGLKPHLLTAPPGEGGTWFAAGAFRLFDAP